MEITSSNNNVNLEKQKQQKQTESKQESVAWASVKGFFSGFGEVIKDYYTEKYKGTDSIWDGTKRTLSLVDDGWDHVKNPIKEWSKEVDKKISDGDDNHMSLGEKAWGVAKTAGSMVDYFTTGEGVALGIALGGAGKVAQAVAPKIAPVVAKVAAANPKLAHGVAVTTSAALKTTGVGLTASGSYDLTTAKTQTDIDKGVTKLMIGVPLAKSTITNQAKKMYNKVKSVVSKSAKKHSSLDLAMEDLRKTLTASDAEIDREYNKLLAKYKCTEKDIEPYMKKLEEEVAKEIQTEQKVAQVGTKTAAVATKGTTAQKSALAKSKATATQSTDDILANIDKVLGKSESKATTVVSPKTTTKSSSIGDIKKGIAKAETQTTDTTLAQKSLSSLSDESQQAKKLSEIEVKLETSIKKFKKELSEFSPEELSDSKLISEYKKTDKIVKELKSTLAKEEVDEIVSKVDPSHFAKGSCITRGVDAADIPIAANYYTGFSGYDRINGILRGERNLDSVLYAVEDFAPGTPISEINARNFEWALRHKQDLAIITSLDKSMTSVATESITVYRGAPGKWIKSAKDGIISDSAFCSTSTAKSVPAGRFLTEGRKLYEIQIPKGAKFCDLTISPEQEILLPRNSQFRVIDEEKRILELVL